MNRIALPHIEVEIGKVYHVEVPYKDFRFESGTIQIDEIEGLIVKCTPLTLVDKDEHGEPFGFHIQSPFAGWVTCELEEIPESIQLSFDELMNV